VTRRKSYIAATLWKTQERLKLVSLVDQAKHQAKPEQDALAFGNIFNQER
jgi:hypothetical protein